MKSYLKQLRELALSLSMYIPKFIHFSIAATYIYIMLAGYSAYPYGILSSLYLCLVFTPIMDKN